MAGRERYSVLQAVGFARASGLFVDSPLDSEGAGTISYLPASLKFQLRMSTGNCLLWYVSRYTSIMLFYSVRAQRPSNAGENGPIDILADTAWRPMPDFLHGDAGAL